MLIGKKVPGSNFHMRELLEKKLKIVKLGELSANLVPGLILKVTIRQLTRIITIKIL